MAGRHNRNGLSRRGLMRDLGPGLITGVADDDPSGISTYTITGATFGYRLLWTSLATLPMNIAVQLICARLGIVTGQGLARIIIRRHGRRLLLPMVILLFIANTVNIGADIGAVAAAVELLTGVSASWLVAPIGVAIAVTEVAVPYATFARVLKLLTLVIFAYVAGAFVAAPDWRAAMAATLVPRLTLEREQIATLVAILGTTISPYLFFWQTSEEVEEESRLGLQGGHIGRRRLQRLLAGARFDVSTGMVLANAGFYFVVLTAAATLHAAGRTDVQTAAEAAEALRPLAGDAATLLFALGIIGTGLLAIPVLAGSVAYAVAEVFDWPEGLSRTLRRAPQFYGVVAVATVLGIAINFLGIPEIRALYLAAIVNGVIAPVLLLVIMVLARDPAVLGHYRTGPLLTAVGWLTAAVMAAAALALVLV